MTALARCFRVLALAGLAWIGIASVAWASSDDPPWRQALDCDPAVQRHAGLEYCTSEEGKIHVIVVDLYSDGVRLEYVIAHGLDRTGQLRECQDVNIPLFGPVRGGCSDPTNAAYYPVMSLGRAVELAEGLDGNSAVVINSDYGAMPSDNPEKSRGHGPEGFTVVRGDRLDGRKNDDKDNNAVDRPWLAVSKEAPLRAELDQLTSDDNGKPDWIYTGVGGWPWLIRDSAIRTTDIAECIETSTSCRAGVPQTAVGLSKDHRWLFLVIDMRKGELRDLAVFMSEQLGAWDAIKLDGGGSSQLWYSGQYISRGDSRELSQYLAVIAPPGSGIEENTQPDSPTDEPAEVLGRLGKAIAGKLAEFGERLRNAAAVKLQEWRQQAEREAARRLEQWEQQLTEWLEREAEKQMEELTSQLCGGSALLPAGLAVILVARKRKRSQMH